MMNMLTAKDVEQAYERIHSYVHRTPLLTSRTLNEISNFQVFMKAENFQKSGSFKIRGAMNFSLVNGQAIA